MLFESGDALFECHVRFREYPDVVANAFNFDFQLRTHFIHARVDAIESMAKGRRERLNCGFEPVKSIIHVRPS